jgi:hypothetical protein
LTIYTPARLSTPPDRKKTDVFYVSELPTDRIPRDLTFLHLLPGRILRDLTFQKF